MENLYILEHYFLDQQVYPGWSILQLYHLDQFHSLENLNIYRVERREKEKINFHA